ncbi:MAG: hypothetical protein V4671_01975 [Armatimonadota bacterium]
MTALPLHHFVTEERKLKIPNGEHPLILKTTPFAPIATSTAFACCVMILSVFPLPSAAAASTPSALGTPSTKQTQPSKSAFSSRIRLEDIADFTRALKTLSRIGQVDCVAESRPLVDRLSPADATRVLAESTSFTILAEKVASAYDYDVSRSGAVLRLRKRYSRSDDLPAVSYKEAVATMQDVLYAFSGFAPVRVRRQDRQDPLLLALASSLSDSEKARMAKGIAIAELSPEKQAAVSNIAYYIAYSVPLNYVRQSLEWANTLKQQNPPFTFADDSALTSLRFDFRLRSSNGSVQVFHNPVSGVDGNGYSTRQGIIDANIDLAKLTALQKRSKQEPTDPTDTTKPTLTLRQVIALLNQRNATNRLDPTKTSYSVDDKTESHTVTLVKGGFSEPMDLFQSVAFLYGLEVRMTPEGTNLLARPRPRAVKSPSGVAQGVRQVLPPSLVRALDSGGRRLQSEHDRKERLSDPLFVESPLINRTTQTAKEMKASALCELVLRLEKEIQASERKSVSFSTMSSESRDLIGLIVLLSNVPKLIDSFLVQPVPSYVRDLGSLDLAGGITTRPDGRQYFTAQVGKKMKNNTFAVQAGIGPGPYLP